MNTVLKVRFSGSQALYTYRNDIECIEKDSMIVVRARNMLSIAKVIEMGGEELIDPEATWEYQYIVDMIDIEGDKMRQRLRSPDYV